MDNYCPHECVCHGRVVQCSDKGIDKVPYGIPYNIRYILLMNNHINRIQHREGNLISSIKKTSLRTLKNLEHLGLARNKILVAPDAFKPLPILYQLDLSHNSLRQVSRKLPQDLHSVAFTHNKIQSVPCDAFCWGDQPRYVVVKVVNTCPG
ncbi:biglycan-like [Pholidichthys leucotaenia]